MSAEIRSEDVALMRDMIVHRRITLGMKWLDERRQLIASFDPSAKYSAAFLGYLAQWVDAGYGSPELLAPLIARYPPAGRDWLSLADYAHVRMAEAVVAMAAEEPDHATERLQPVLMLAGEIRD